MWKSALPVAFTADLPLLQTSRCLSCQFRNPTILTRFRTKQYPVRHYASKTEKPISPKDPAPVPRNRKNEAQNRLSSAIEFKQNLTNHNGPQPGDEDFTPPHLDRPIGSPQPPVEGQNTGIDPRSMRQRRDDFTNYERHIERRKELYETTSLCVDHNQVAKPVNLY